MKTKKEILKMNEDELLDYKWSYDLKEKETKKNTNKHCHSCNYCNSCDSCHSCNYCNYCNSCKNLTYGLYCRNLKLEKEGKYYICNVKVTKKEFETKCNELGITFKK